MGSKGEEGEKNRGNIKHGEGAPVIRGTAICRRLRFENGNRDERTDLASASPRIFEPLMTGGSV